MFDSMWMSLRVCGPRQPCRAVVDWRRWCVARWVVDLGEGSVLAAVAAALAAVDVDVGVLSDAGLRRVLADAERLGAGLRALQARLVAEANRRDLARRDGAASPAAWLTTQLGISAGEAARRQDEATAVTASAAVGDALD